MDRKETSTEGTPIGWADNLLLKYEKTVFSWVKANGTLTTDEHGQARINYCKTRNGGNPCEYFGEVNPLPMLKCEGCTACGCPLGTKAFMLDLLGDAVICRHPEGNFWEEVDSNFLT